MGGGGGGRGRGRKSVCVCGSGGGGRQLQALVYYYYILFPTTAIVGYARALGKLGLTDFLNFILILIHPCYKDTYMHGAFEDMRHLCIQHFISDVHVK